MNEPRIRLGFIGTLRWIWRTLTMMRTAIILLFLLAIAAIPGSVLPQRGQADSKVNTYLREHPALGPWLDRFSFFDVFGSPWFASIYLLLMVSLVGCVVPRTKQLLIDLRRPPAEPPRDLQRLSHRIVQVDASALPAALDSAEALLRARRFRVLRKGDAIAAEKGLLKEVGNLVFHFGLLVILIGVAQGSIWGYRGQVIVREGSSFSNVIAQYDTFKPGRLVRTESLTPFTVHLDRFIVKWDENPSGMPQPNVFKAYVTTAEAEAKGRSSIIEVNEPLEVGPVSLFLVGHGYAPHIRVTDARGRVVFDDTVVFLPRDGMFTSDGVIKVPDAEPQLGFNAIFAPTAVITGAMGPHSVYPDTRDPEMFISAWVGDLGMDSGVPQNVYSLDKTKLKRIGLEEMAPGESWTLPDGKGKVEFVGITRYATFNVNNDPGQGLALFAAILALGGLLAMLYIRRRTIWVRGRIAEDGGGIIEVAGLGKNERTDLGAELDAFAQGIGKDK